MFTPKHQLSAGRKPGGSEGQRSGVLYLVLIEDILTIYKFSGFGGLRTRVQDISSKKVNLCFVLVQ